LPAGKHGTQIFGRPRPLLQTAVKHSAARGIYKITARLPVESEGCLTYRIKSAVETFERTADEVELSAV